MMAKDRLVAVLTGEFEAMGRVFDAGQAEELVDAMLSEMATFNIFELFPSPDPPFPMFSQEAFVEAVGYIKDRKDSA